MFMTKFLKTAAFSALAITLAACTHKAGPVNGTVESADDQAKAYALGQKQGVTGADVNGLGRHGQRFVNVDKAPSHQVYYFAYDQSHMSVADVHSAVFQAKYLLANPNAKVRLEGNADDRGSREYNVALGWRRAKTVKQLFMQQGVAANQIETVSYGKEHPAVVGNNEQAYSLNRRVELIYVRE